MNGYLQDYLEQEEGRSDSTLNLIASENYPSREVGLALTSITGSKYAEGYPHKRYYAGCATIDEIEDLAIELCKSLFGVKYTNVQPHSGSNANLASFIALLEPGDRVLAPAMDSGGHLTHGASASVTSKLWDFTHYHAESPALEYNLDTIAKLANKVKPKLIIAGTSAYSKLIDWAGFRTIADSVDAYLLADIAHLAGLMAGKAIPSATTHAHVLTASTQKTLRGPRGGIIMTNDSETAKKIDRAVFPALQGGPHIHTIAAKAQCFSEASQPEFIDYAKQVIQNADTLNRKLSDLGCDMWCDFTETHLLNINTQKSFGIDGKIAEEKLETQGIIANREIIPNDKNALQPSGIRLGTAALTTRGMREAQMIKIAQLIVSVLRENKEVKDEVTNLTKLFPL